MIDPNKLSIVDWEWWFTLKILEKTDITDAELVELLGNKRITRIQNLQLAKKEEEYERLKPAWFDSALVPQSAKKKREKAQSTDNVEQLQWMHDNVSYNSDGTMNIIKLNTTFCEDISWTGQTSNREEAKQLAESKWYRLGSDYNDCDSKDIKEDSDWYKVINIFSNGKWDTLEGMKLFRDMAWCNNRYWTATPHKDKNWDIVSGVARTRTLHENPCSSACAYAGYVNRVCGFKDSIATREAG